jgi:hypothetical protein
MPASSTCRSVVGATCRLVPPAKVTRPTLNSSGSPRTNSRAASSAACSRLGSTSVARIDAEASTATITVARSRGTCTSSAGRAKPATSGTSIARNRPAGRCRRQPGRLGATLSSSARFVKRTV